MKEENNKEILKELIKLLSPISKYASVLLEDFENKKRVIPEEINRIIKMWEKFHNLNDSITINELSKIFKEEIDKEPKFLFIRFDFFNNTFIKEYFMKKGIDTQKIFTRAYSGDSDYFLKYGLEEKIRFEKVEIELVNNFRKIMNEKKMEGFSNKINRFVEKARERGLSGVTQASIKNIAVELIEDTDKILNQLTNAVNTQLEKDWGKKPKRKRDSTHSINMEILKRDNWTCQTCGKDRKAGLEIHHIIPHSKGGLDEMDNLITLCESCNRSIGDRRYAPPKEWIGWQIYPKWANQ